MGIYHYTSDHSQLYRVDLFWEKNSKKVSFGLVTESSQTVGNVIEYDSMPANGNEDNSYDCSIAFHDEHVRLFFDFLKTFKKNLF